VLEGAGLNLTVLSYCGSVDFGFAVAADAVPDVWDLAACVRPACDELYEAACHKGGEQPAEVAAPPSRVVEVPSEPAPTRRRPSARAKA
jgi:hypothetical protein